MASSNRHWHDNTDADVLQQNLVEDASLSPVNNINDNNTLSTPPFQPDPVIDLALLCDIPNLNSSTLTETSFPPVQTPDASDFIMQCNLSPLSNVLDSLILSTTTQDPTLKRKRQMAKTNRPKVRMTKRKTAQT